MNAQGGREVLEHFTVPATDKHVVKTAAATLLVHEQMVEVDTTTAAFTLVLPSVAEAKGRTFTIHLVAGAINACTLTDFPSASFNDSRDWAGDFTLDAANDLIALTSDGEKWIVDENRIA